MNDVRSMPTWYSPHSTTDSKQYNLNRKGGASFGLCPLFLLVFFLLHKTNIRSFCVESVFFVNRFACILKNVYLCAMKTV